MEKKRYKNISETLKELKGHLEELERASELNQSKKEILTSMISLLECFDSFEDDVNNNNI